MIMSSIKKRPPNPFHLLSLVVSATALPMLAAGHAALDSTAKKIGQLFRDLYSAPVSVLGVLLSPFFFLGHFYSCISRNRLMQGLSIPSTHTFHYLFSCLNQTGLSRTKV